MKAYLALIAIFLLSFGFSSAQSFFVSSIQFKGQSEGRHFKGRDFDINLEKGNFVISQHEEEAKVFLIGRNNSSILDLVFSPNRSAVAVAMCATDLKNRQRALVTVDAAGKKRIFEYEAYKMTERLGWIVELGAVSDDGMHILAKCALMLPENEDGRSDVRHEWTVLKMGDASIKVLDSITAIDKWPDYARSR